MRDTLIFDFDGTLIDSAPGILATYAEVLSAAGIAPAVPLDQHLVGPPLQPTMEKLLGHRHADSELLQALIEDFKVRYASTGVAHTPAYPGADQALSALRTQGHTLYLATNKRAAPTLALLEKFGWQQHFRQVYCIDSRQPPYADKTAMLRQLLSENRLSAQQALYVGDTHGDYLAASTCGIDFAAAQWGYENWGTLADQKEVLKRAYTSLHALSQHLAAVDKT